MSNDNTDTTTVSDNNTDDVATGNSNTENTTTVRLVWWTYPHLYVMVEKLSKPSKVKTSKKCTPIMVEPSIGDPLPNEIVTAKVSGHAFNPTDVHMYEFLIQGTPNPLDLEGIEEDQLLEIQ